MAMQVVLREKYNVTGGYYNGWYTDEKTGEQRIYTVYDDPTQAKVLKMFGFEIAWGDHPPPDSIKQELLTRYEPIPVKVVVLS